MYFGGCGLKGRFFLSAMPHGVISALSPKLPDIYKLPFCFAAQTC